MATYNLSIYPFSAIVGQDLMKTALLLNVIDPKIGGVLIRGEKGTAKSTAVRSLAGLLPLIEVVADCPFHCDPDDFSCMCENCREKYEKELTFDIHKVSVKVINVPLGVTEDRLLGTINIEKVLKDGKKYFEPGILAQANRNILYIDEVNLLEDHIVDELLDVSAMGVNIVEREGISYSHPSRFILVGTMNPEEGELRPQLLDRFGLSVNVETLKDELVRKEIIKRRLSFENNPEAFAKKWQKEDKEIAKRVVKAKSLLKKIKEEEWVYDVIAKICISANISGHRADTVILRSAKAYSALMGKTSIEIGDVETAARLALLHRLKKLPFEDEKKVEDVFDNIQVLLKEYEEKKDLKAPMEFREKKSLKLFHHS
ncbi:MAG: AAA family ATPase [Proteobacteria bacterium]|nr:AAA family ATPase [Pseudomonadota bacterium]